MSRYHVDTAGNLEVVRQAINAAWRATPAGGTVTHMVGGVVTGTESLVAYEARMGIPPVQVVSPGRLIIVGADAALDIPDTGKTAIAIAPLLGQGGIPSAASLVQVSRPRENDRLPAGVRDRLDDLYVDAELVEDAPAARGRVNAELQGRAAAALARKDARGGQPAFVAGRSR